MRRIFLSVCLSALLAAPTTLFAQIDLGGQLSWAEDADLGIGARTTLGLPTQGVPLEVIGSFDFFFPDDIGGADVDYWEINGNLVYVFPVPTPTVKPYAGGGLNIAHVSVEGADDNTEVGLNLLGGVKFPLTNLTPFGELRIELDGGEQQPVITGGILFNVGPGLSP